MADDLDAIKGWVSSWARHELRLKGHVFYRMLLAASVGVHLELDGYIDEEDVLGLPSDFDPSPLIAKGGADADAALGAIAALYLLDGKAMPRGLAEFISHMLLERFHSAPPRKRGGTKYRLLARDHLTYLLVNRLIELGYKRTKNREPKHSRESASSLAARLLTEAGIPTTARAVEEAYSKFR